MQFRTAFEMEQWIRDTASSSFHHPLQGLVNLFELYTLADWALLATIAIGLITVGTVICKIPGIVIVAINTALLPVAETEIPNARLFIEHENLWIDDLRTRESIDVVVHNLGSFSVSDVDVWMSASLSRLDGERHIIACTTVSVPIHPQRSAIVRLAIIHHLFVDFEVEKFLGLPDYLYSFRDIAGDKWYGNDTRVGRDENKLKEITRHYKPMPNKATKSSKPKLAWWKCVPWSRNRERNAAVEEDVSFPIGM